MVPGVGLEPTLHQESDPRSDAAANYTIRAHISVYEEAGTLLPLTTRQAG